MQSRNLIVMVREKGRNIGHIHRILISSVGTNRAMESKIRCRK